MWRDHMRGNAFFGCRSPSPRIFSKSESEKGLLFLVAFRMRFSQNTNPLFPKKLFCLSALFGFSLFRKVGVSVKEMVLWAFHEKPTAHLVSEKKRYIINNRQK